ncbi:MAG: O-acetyl-ADP-ribose deacetylase [Magnetococcales bacterium]|nr:O-acetyl-ADP-ribose deacetylase [Magnetococcales bacterium]
MLEVVVGDITQLRVDAIVNAANASLLGGGGVDGAIHRAGGGAILEECRALRREKFPDGLPTGEAVVTGGGKLPARWVIHTVGPIYDQDYNPPARLEACYRNCLQKARELGAEEVAFPAISTGVYGFPKERAARIAVTTLRAELTRHGPPPRRVILVAYSEADAAILRRACAN